MILHALAIAGSLLGSTIAHAQSPREQLMALTTQL